MARLSASSLRAATSLRDVLYALDQVTELVAEVVAPAKVHLLAPALVADHDRESRARVYETLAQARLKVRRAIQDLRQ